MFRAICLGLLVSVYFWKGLEATGWVFYELHHLTDFEALYYGYSIFRGLHHFFSLWSYYEFFCIGLGFTFPLISFYLRKK